MPKTKISEFDVDPANNTDINSINIAEGCAPSGINNAIRQLMSDLKEQLTGASGDPFTVGGAFAANGGATLGDASGDALTINSSAVSIPNGLNFDSNTFVIDATNNRVGVGTASPSQRLHVASAGTVAIQAENTASTGAAYLKSTNTATTCNFGVDATGGYIETLGAYATLFYTNSTERMRIDSSGNVGIGTSSPASGQQLTVQSGAATQIRCRSTTTRYRTGWGIDTSGNTTVDSYDDTGAVYTQITLNGNPLNFSISGTERMRLDSSGNLLVGTTSNASGYRLYVNGGNDRGMQLDSPSGSGVYSTLNFAQNGSIQTQLFWFSTTDEFIIQNTSGGVKLTNGATSWASASDERLKDIIEPIANAAEKVSSLRAVIGKYKTDSEEKRRTFLIAQDVQAVLPEAVYSAQQARSEDETEYLHLQYTDTIPLLVAAIQELKAEVDALKAQINQ